MARLEYEISKTIDCIECSPKTEDMKKILKSYYSGEYIIKEVQEEIIPDWL